MRPLAVAVLSVVVAVVVVLGGAALRFGAWPSGPDAMGFAASVAVSGVILVTAVHWPVLASLQRRGVTLGPARAALVAALGVNAPVYALLAAVGRDRSLFAGGEAALLAAGFASMAAVFGAGYATYDAPTTRGLE